MATYSFYQLDVFTQTAFSGNPLAVFPEAEGLNDEQMQKIASEMNLSETVFVLPSDKALRRLRIFTPVRELPLAGHPVVGTWNLLANLGYTPQVENGTIEIQHELNVGILPVEIGYSDGNPVKVEMTQAKFESGEIIENESEINSITNGLGLSLPEIAASRELPVEVVSTGIKALVVPVVSLDALSRCRINSSLLSECYLSRGAVGVYAFTFETIEDSSKVHARFFAPGDNIPEDPATGSAAGSLSGYLVHHGAFENDGDKVSVVQNENSFKFTIEQGDFMNRPSRIFANVTGRKGDVLKVKIGGCSVVVAHGELFF